MKTEPNIYTKMEITQTRMITQRNWRKWNIKVHQKLAYYSYATEV